MGRRLISRIWITLLFGKLILSQLVGYFCVIVEFGVNHS